jgi:hypothetical protein
MCRLHMPNLNPFNAIYSETAFLRNVFSKKRTYEILASWDCTSFNQDTPCLRIHATDTQTGHRSRPRRKRLSSDDTYSPLLQDLKVGGVRSISDPSFLQPCYSRLSLGQQQQTAIPAIIWSHSINETNNITITSLNLVCVSQFWLLSLRQDRFRRNLF